MLRLITDQTTIERVLNADVPMRCKGIRMKQRALYRAYGTKYPFCSYYIAEDEKAIAVLYNSSLYFSDALNRADEWEDVISALPIAVCSSDTVLDTDGFTVKSGNVFYHPASDLTCPVAGEEILSNDIDATYAVIKQIFPDTFGVGTAEEQETYMNWYCEMSHRIRHGVTELLTVKDKATATVFCKEENAVFLSQIGVLPEYRRNGYGRFMLRLILEQYAGMDAFVFSKNPNADRFYTALGFANIGSWQDYTR